MAISSRAAALLALASTVALASWSLDAAFGAGPLTQGHATLADDCTACHAPFRGPDPTRCASCHAPDSVPAAARATALGRDRFATLAALHADTSARPCLACHTDHAGRDAARGTRAFAHERLARDVLDRCASCHAAVAPADAVHERPTGCAACHGTARWVPAAFRHDSTDGQLAQRCTECHGSDTPRDDGLHAPDMRACAECHGTTRWAPTTFDHTRFFVLDRDHDVRCATCHDARTGFASYTCYGCHEHTPAGTRREHAEEGITRNLAQCARCHTSADDEGGHGDGGRRGRDDD